MLDDVQIVLCGTSHPGNLGASVRAMKTMGVNHISLVSPVLSKEDSVEVVRSSHASDILEQALIFDSLQDAISKSSCVLGLTSRSRKKTSIVSLSLSTAIRELVFPLLRQKKMVSFVFGSEKTGLTNDQLRSCSRIIHIPTSDEYPSLNLAAAVQVVCYELRRYMVDCESFAEQPAFQVSQNPATAQELHHLMNHFKQVLHRIRFINSSASKTTLDRFYRICSKADLDKEEVSLLRGVLAQFEYYIAKYDNQ